MLSATQAVGHQRSTFGLMRFARRSLSGGLAEFPGSADGSEQLGAQLLVEAFDAVELHGGVEGGSGIPPSNAQLRIDGENPRSVLPRLIAPQVNHRQIVVSEIRVASRGGSCSLMSAS